MDSAGKPRSIGDAGVYLSCSSVFSSRSPEGSGGFQLCGSNSSIIDRPARRGLAGAGHEPRDRGVCLAHKIAPPEFSEQAGVVTVTLRAAVGPEEAEAPSRDQAGTKCKCSNSQRNHAPSRS